MTQNNLGAALQEQGIRTAGEAGARLLSGAAAAYRAALEVYTRESLPQDWAMTQNNLGNALANQGIRTAGEAGARLLSEGRRGLQGGPRCLHPREPAGAVGQDPEQPGGLC